MKSVTWDGKIYGIPTNNETMAFIWNADIFKEAGLDPDKAPATWDDVVTYSKQIKEKLGMAGYGLVARKRRQHAVPLHAAALGLWRRRVRRGRGPATYKTITINNEGSKAALQASYDMYVRDKSVPSSALTNTQTENQAPFIAGQLGMMITHPSEYAVMLDKAKRATGADKSQMRWSPTCATA